MSFFEKVKHKFKVIGKNIVEDPSAALSAAAFGMLAGSQLGFDISILRELRKIAKSHNDLASWIVTKLVPAIDYNDKYAIAMINAMCNELEEVKPGFCETMHNIATEYNAMNRGPVEALLKS